MHGLSRRRSRVRVPSLPQKPLQIRSFCCPTGRNRPSASLIPHRSRAGMAARSRVNGPRRRADPVTIPRVSRARIGLVGELVRCAAALGVHEVARRSHASHSEVDRDCPAAEERRRLLRARTWRGGVGRSSGVVCGEARHPGTPQRPRPAGEQPPPERARYLPASGLARSSRVRGLRSVAAEP
jgi:hypothetical protein